MNERLLQYIWQFQYYNKSQLQTAAGEHLKVLSPGSLNTNQGPDFSNARIQIGSIVLAGSIELHCKTSDWTKHHHQKDANYNNVILHVVYQHDDVDTAADIPILELQPLVSSIMLNRYAALMNAQGFIACSHSIGSVKEITWTSWKERLVAERLTRKSEKIIQALQESSNHWEQVFWLLLSRSFGSKVNGDAFESIAETISINLLAKHKNRIHQLEALLLGQANLLNEELDDSYYKLLQREYQFLKKKYSLHPSPLPVHFLRMRPGNFPSLRLAQLAMLVNQSSHLFSSVKNATGLSEVRALLDITANDYWHYHYHFSQTSAYLPKRLGKAIINSVIINTIAPVLFAYGWHHKEEKYQLKALRWLEEVDGEKNSILEQFVNLNVENKTAFDSQALLELNNEYCTKKRCIECSVGNFILKTL